MDNTVFVALITVAGTLLGTIVGGLIGGWYSLKAAKVGFKKETMKKKIKDYANLLISYQQLEKEYLSEISKLNNNTPHPKKVKENVRKAVKEKGFVYPKISENEVKEVLKKYE